jgi:hypothetical protein
MYASTTSFTQPIYAEPTFAALGTIFQRTVQRAKLAKTMASLTGRSSQLPDAATLTGGRAVRNQRDLGTKTVAIDRILASEDRSGDFDRSFRPLATHIRGRWINIAVARLNGTPLPAVDLIKIGDAYMVRDGHHRISVAKTLGADFVDAHVTAWELSD